MAGGEGTAGAAPSGVADEDSEVSDTDLLAAVGAVASAVEAQEARDIIFLQQVEVVLQHWRAGAPAKAAAVEVRRLVLLEDIAAGSGPPDCPPLEAQGRGFMHGHAKVQQEP